MKPCQKSTSWLFKQRRERKTDVEREREFSLVLSPRQRIPRRNEKTQRKLNGRGREKLKGFSFPYIPLYKIEIPIVWRLENNHKSFQYFSFLVKFNSTRFQENSDNSEIKEPNKTYKYNSQEKKKKVFGFQNILWIFVFGQWHELRF